MDSIKQEIELLEKVKLKLEGIKKKKMVMGIIQVYIMDSMNHQKIMTQI